MLRWCCTLRVNGGALLFCQGALLSELISRCVGGRDRQVEVSLQHHATTTVLLQGVLLDSAVFAADGVDYLVAAVYKEEDRTNGNNCCCWHYLLSIRKT